MQEYRNNQGIQAVPRSLQHSSFNQKQSCLRFCTIVQFRGAGTDFRQARPIGDRDAFEIATKQPLLYGFGESSPYCGLDVWPVPASLLQYLLFCTSLKHQSGGSGEASHHSHANSSGIAMGGGCRRRQGVGGLQLNKCTIDSLRPLMFLQILNGCYKRDFFVIFCALLPVERTLGTRAGGEAIAPTPRFWQMF